jgi:hypothetical protein
MDCFASLAMTAIRHCEAITRHCEERSDVAIQRHCEAEGRGNPYIPYPNSASALPDWA